MDEIQEDKLILYRRKENIIRNIEENEAKTDETIRTKLQSNVTNIGPANDLLRFLYILEQQYQNDDDEIRTKARENVLEYIDQFRQSDDVTEDEEDNQPKSTPIIPYNPQPNTTTSQSSPVVITPSQTSPVIVTRPQPSPVVITPSQTSPVIVTPSQTSPVTVTRSQPSPVVVTPPQPSPAVVTPQQPLTPTTELEYIKPDTLIRYQKLLSEAQEYENRYTTVAAPRKKQLEAPLRAIMNKLRQDTFNTLKNDLWNFLNGHEQNVSGQSIRITNEEERLLCLKMLTSLIFNQLLGSDLTEAKTEIFLPLVGQLSENQQQKEFRIIFLDRLHKQCPYTVPMYPKRESTMNDKEYLKAMGYTEKKEGNQSRLETETEFLNRMSGLIRFFCKLLVRRGPPFDNDSAYAWKWMADVLNLPPRRNISAVVLRIFLDETGESMAKQYSKQFSEKIIQYIRLQYLPKLKEQTTEDQLARLQITLETITKKS